MFKKVLICVTCFLICIPVLQAGRYVYAQGTESLTITTYYPSPYGSYNQLQTNRLAVGDTDGSGGLDAADQPNRDGDIRLIAQPGDPTTAWPAGTIGQFAYSSADDELYHYNGSAWVAQGSGGGCYTDYSLAMGLSVGSPCSVSGFIVEGSVGTYGYCCDKPACGDSVHFRQPGSACVPPVSFSFTIGEAYICCQ